MSIEGKEGLRNSILVTTLTYGSETWTWTRAQKSRVHVVEMSYLRRTCGVKRWEGESKESMYERCGTGRYTDGVHCGLVEWVERNPYIEMIWRGWGVRSL